MQDDLATRGANGSHSLGLPGDLMPRLISGLVLAAVALGLNYAGVVPFALLVTVVALLMSWEWGRVVRHVEIDSALLIHSGSAVVAVWLGALGYAALGVVLLIAAAIIVATLRAGSGGRISGLGVLYVGLPAVSLMWLRNDEPYGFVASLFLFLIAWTTDTAAFATGRLIGGPKLWPKISPKKTWAGFLGGIGASAAAGAMFAAFVPGASPTVLAVSALCLGVIAQAGDLAESALKRLFGVKDSSGLIPGHGGFMDRVDSLVAAALAAALIGLLMNPRAPAQALLFGG